MSFDTALVGKRIGFVREYRGEFFPFEGIVTAKGYIRTILNGYARPTAELALQSLREGDGLERIFVDPLVSYSAFAHTTVEQLEASELGECGIAESFIADASFASA